MVGTSHSPPATSHCLTRHGPCRMVMGLYRLWYLRGYWSEGREWLTAILGSGAAAGRPRAMLLRRVGQLAWLQGDYPAARAGLEECLALYREVGSAEDLPGALNALGELARTQGDYPAARALFAESLALLRCAGRSAEHRLGAAGAGRSGARAGRRRGGGADGGEPGALSGGGRPARGLVRAQLSGPGGPVPRRSAPGALPPRAKPRDPARPGP